LIQHELNKKKGQRKESFFNMASSLRLGVGLLVIVALMISTNTVESKQECHTSGCSIYKYGCMKGYTRTELPCYANEERMGLSGLRKDNGPFVFKRMYKIKCCKKSAPPPFIPPYRRYPRKDGEVEP